MRRASDPSASASRPWRRSGCRIQLTAVHTARRPKASAMATWSTRRRSVIRTENSLNADISTTLGEQMKWITRKNASVDRIACPWLIKRFIDPEPEFDDPKTRKLETWSCTMIPTMSRATSRSL